jgi:hypothetical protein
MITEDERTIRAIHEIRDLVEKYRTTCFWFMNDRWLPDTAAAARRAAILLQRYGDRQAYVSSAALLQWL